MISIYQKTLKQKELKQIPDAIPGAWIHASKPTEAELEKLVLNHSFDKGMLEDAIDPYETPRIEIEEGVAYFYTRLPSKSTDSATAPFMIALHPEFTLTVTLDGNSFVNAIAKKDPATTQKIKFMLVMLAEINRQYFKSITSIRKHVNRIKVRPDQVADKDILSFIELENDLNEYLNALSPLAGMYRRLATGSIVPLFEDDKDLVEDLELNAEQLIDGSRNILRMIVNIREAYSVITTNRLNEVIRVLTTLTVLLTIPTMITSFFGMNVRLPLENNPLASHIIIGVTIIVVALIILFFKKRKWL